MRLKSEQAAWEYYRNIHVINPRDTKQAQVEKFRAWVKTWGITWEEEEMRFSDETI